MGKGKRVKRFTKSLTAIVPEETYQIVLRKAEERDATISEITRELVLYAISSLGWDKEQEQSPPPLWR